VSVYFGPAPVIPWPSKLNFGPFSKNRPKSLPEQATSLDFAGLRVDLTDFAAQNPDNAGHVFFSHRCAPPSDGNHGVTVYFGPLN
jgi:hypothetical protein